MRELRHGQLVNICVCRKQCQVAGRANEHEVGLSKSLCQRTELSAPPVPMLLLHLRPQVLNLASHLLPLRGQVPLELQLPLLLPTPPPVVEAVEANAWPWSGLPRRVCSPSYYFSKTMR